MDDLSLAMDENTIALALELCEFESLKPSECRRLALIAHSLLYEVRRLRALATADTLPPPRDTLRTLAPEGT